MQDDRLNAALAMAREAGALAQKMRANPETLDTRIKGPMDLVTAADHAVEVLLRERILAHQPGVAILGEENGLEGQGREVWILDPIDGTVNFCRGTQSWGVSIGYFDGTDLTHGVIHAPDLNMTAWAVRGEGAYLNGTRIQFDDAGLLAPIVALGYSPRRPLADYFALIEKLQAARIEYRRYGAATICFLGVLAGWFDAFHEASLNIWDAAAGLLLIQEAGGTVQHADFDAFLQEPSAVTACTRSFTAPEGVW